MEIEQLRKELNDLLDNVVDHSSNYSGNRQIPSLEISYVLTKINKMQETLIILKHLIKEEEKKIKKEKQLKRQLVQDSVVKEVKEEKIEIDVQPEEVVVEDKQPEIEELPITETNAEDVQGLIVEEKDVVEQAATPITNMEQLSIAKLVDAFSLNDRYLYANELFGKDMAAFNEVVKNIDASNNFEEAKAILMNIGSERSWDVEDENVLSFANLVERRFL